MRMNKLWRSVGLSPLLFVVAGCINPEDTLPAEETITVNNDVTELNSRVEKKSDTLPIERYEDASGRIMKKDLKLILTTQVAPPEIDGTGLQASSVARRGEKLMVSYNFRGEIYLGGADFMELEEEELEIHSQVLFQDADIHNVDFSGSYLYLAAARSRSDSQAYVHRIKVKGKQLDLDDNMGMSLGSYAANCIDQDGSNVYITSGDDELQGGGLYLLDGKFKMKSHIPLHDARWVMRSGKELFVAQGTPGKISVIDSKNLTVKREIAVDGANVPEAKTTLDVADGLIFFAAGEEGLMVFDKTTGQLLHRMTFPDTASITNAVTAEDEMIFISNGEGGIYVASYDKKMKVLPPSLIGKLTFEDPPSINHIHYEDEALLVAAGADGLMVIEVDD